VALRVRILDSAARDLARLDRPIGRRVVERISWLAANFEATRPEPLGGSLSGFYKLRVGDFRVIYELLRAEQTLMVHAIGHRREIYRKS